MSPVSMGVIQNSILIVIIIIINAGEELVGEGTQFTVYKNVIIHNHYGRQYGDFSES